jgi:chromosome segregation ATPase
MGNCNNGCNAPKFVSQAEFAYAQEVNKKDAELAQLKSEKYTDNNIIAAYKETVAQFKAADDRISGVVKETTQAFIETGKEVAVLKTEVSCLKEQIAAMKENSDQKLNYELKGVYREINCAKNELEGAIKLESERRSCGDRNLYEYVNGTFVPGKLVMPADSVCPQPMSRYNSWAAPTNTGGQTTTGQ